MPDSEEQEQKPPEEKKPPKFSMSIPIYVGIILFIVGLGIGALIEGEIIISGTTLGHKVRVYDIWQLDEVFDD